MNLEEATPSSRRPGGAPRVSAYGGAALSSAGVRRILVAVALDDASAVALERADGVARCFGAELHVIHVRPPVGWVAALFAPRTAAGALAASEQLWAVADATRALCEHVLHRHFPAGRVHVTQGPVARSIIAKADDLDASLVVVGGSGPLHVGDLGGRIAGKILRSAHRPVLVARPPTASGAIIAASDLTDEHYPALVHGASLGAHLHAPVTFLHNVNTLETLIAATPYGAPASIFQDPLGETMAQRGELLRNIAVDLQAQEIETRILCCESATEAILEIAQQQDADLVVVGTHRRTTFDALLGPGTAESVAAWTQRSVLAVPLEDNEPRAYAA